MKTDPQNDRAAILAGVVESLAALAGQKSVGGTRRVAAAVSFFSKGADATPSYPWTFLDDQTSSKLSAWIASEVPGRNQGQATDYQAALTAARTELAQSNRVFDGARDVCKVMLFFTDGGINVDNDDAATEQAKLDMCAPGGLLDGIRSDHDSLIAVRLLASGSAGEKRDQESRDLLQQMAEGQSDATGTLCGSPIVSPSVSGTYLEGGIDALAVLFGTALGVGAGGTLVPGLGGSPLPFSIDRGVESFQIVAQAPSGFSLLAPDGSRSEVSVRDTSLDIAGTSGSVRWAGNAFTLILPVTDSGIGKWVLTRVGQDDEISLVLFSGLEIHLDDAKLVVDEASKLTGQIVTKAGQPADLSVYADKSLSIVQGTGADRGVPQALDLNDDGSFSGDFTPNEGSTEVTFLMNLAVTTAGGLKMHEVTREFRQPVRLPDIYPNVNPHNVEFGALEHGGEKAEAVLTLTGSPKGPTQVCVGSPTLVGSDPVDLLQVDSPVGCLDLAKDEVRDVVVSIELRESVTNGSQIAGEIPLEVVSTSSAASGSRTKQISVPFTGQVVPVPPVLWVVPVLLALGILVPLLALWIMNWLSARLALDGMYRMSLPVSLVAQDFGWVLRRAVPESTGTGVATQQSSGLLFTHRDFQPMDANLDRERGWNAPDGEVLSGHASWNPFGSILGRVTAPRDFFVFGNRNPMTAKQGSRAGIDMRPQGNAYVLISHQAALEDSVPARLVAYIRPGVNDLNRQAADLERDVSQFLGWADAIPMLREQSLGLKHEEFEVPEHEPRSTNQPPFPTGESSQGLGTVDGPDKPDASTPQFKFD